MLRSRSRSGSVDFGQKNHHSSIFSKKLSASKLCRGDAIAAQIDANALKSVSNLSENRVNGVMLLQQQMRGMEEELRSSKEKINASELEKIRALDESSMELENLKKILATTRDELKTKDRKIGGLELELGKARQDEADKDASLGILMKELRDVREREIDSNELLAQNKRRIQELEGEIERRRQTESRMADSLVKQSRQLDSAMFELEESKIEIASLQEKVDGLEDLCNQISKEAKGSSNDEETTHLKSELDKAREGEKRALLKAQRLEEEMQLLKREYRFAIEGEDKSSQAMEDLAMALREVAMEANQARQQVITKEEEVEAMKAEVEKMKEMLEEAKQDMEAYKSTADTLRAETEETLFAWNAKEIGFMSCIKRAEEEKAVAQIENHKLSESLKAAENMTRAAREDTYKLRDILKQAINESNAAKAAAGIARDENSLLKDCLAEKEEALHFTTKENERLRISEAAAQEHVKQLKRMLTVASAEVKVDEKSQMRSVMFTEPTDDDDDDDDDEEEEEEEEKPHSHNRQFSLDVEDLKFMNEDGEESDEDPEKAEALKGSIFDTSAETPKSEKAAFSRLQDQSAEDEKVGDDDHGHEDGEGDKQQNHRRPKSMFQRVGGLLTMGKSLVHRPAAPAPTQPANV